ncbi:annulin-like [Pecten maximus]|uniref:annulin-like n=1 Tax=Pecten maximus TaxID=6579 RepID=UPI0014584181|nr:annulin-like [Pecten maximus]
MGCGSSSSGYSPPTRNRPQRTKPPVTFEVNQEKQGGTESEKASLIQVKTVSFLTVENCFDHHTDEYDIAEHKTAPRLVIRRGQSFQLQVELDRPYDPAKDKMSLEFDIGSRPTQTKSTLIKVDLDGVEEKNQWNAKIQSSEKNTKLIIIVTPSPSCIIGRWGVHIKVSNKNSREKGAPYAFKIYTQEQKIYILFNPWCKEDNVYLDDEGLKREYVLNESGKLYFGRKGRISARPWNFGQFDDVILDCVLDLLDGSMMDIKDRASPIFVVRKLSALVNNCDDNGILVGNWSGKYENGKSPTAWTGSVAILQKYYETKRPVKYGQCWVFSAVMTTCCRTLGIPARSVTNFASAHDTDMSITIDKHYNANRNPLKHLNNDSVWNFHVWNDVWMKRPDLPGDYGGWQACDATPQEKSEGVFCCGPFPLKALKSGELNLPYDGAFIFAEMNADRVDWMLNEDGKFEAIKVTPSSIGFNISTHLPKCKGSSHLRREDVTSEYKHAEGSSEEKAALNNANKHSTVAGMVYGHTDNQSQDVTFELKQQDDIVFGQPYEAEVTMENKSGDTRTVAADIVLDNMTSDGHPEDTVRYESETFVIPGGEKRSLKMAVPFEEYNKKTLQLCNFMLRCSCEVKETHHVFVDEDSFCMDKVDLDVTGPETCRVGDAITIEATFRNPLPIALTSCTLDVEGGKIQKPRTITLSESVEASGKFKTSFSVTPSKAGERTVNIVFNSRELENISGSVEIQVKP